MRWLKARLIAVALLPGSWLLFSLAYSRGDRETLLRAWRPVVIGSFAVPLALVLLFWNRMLSAPAGADELHGGVLLTRAGSAVLVVSLLGLVLVLMNMERTLRASVGVMRWRIKYMVIGLGVVLATRLYTTSQAIVYSASDPSVDVLNPCALLIGCAIMLGSLLRAPLLKVDLYLSHTVLYHSFTVLLVAVYLLAVGILAHLATRLGDVRGFPVKAFVVFMALIGLPILLTSDRVRQRTRRFISAHLRRPRYDYRRVWDAFTRRTASHMAAPDYCRAVAQVVSDTFEVLSVTIWLLDESRDRLAFGGSTSLQAGHVSDLVPAGQAAELLAALR
jgi:hypothetical protein